MIYFDNAATTRPIQSLYDVENFGNPSAAHELGIKAEKIVKGVARILAKHSGFDENEVVFTSGGTESNNTALNCFNLSKGRGNCIVTNRAEHPSVLAFCDDLAKKGLVTIEFVKLGENGLIDLEHYSWLFDKNNVAFVSVAVVNNETGVIQPIAKLVDIGRKKSAYTLFHTDAVQGFGKIRLDDVFATVDFASVSAHKIHGAKGVGALFVKKGAPFQPLIFGGGQQNGRRSGTENTSGIWSFGEAVEACFANFGENLAKIGAVRRFLIDELSKFEGVFINGDINFSSPYILNFSVVGVKSEIFLHALEEKGIYVSAGSACSSRKKLSGVLVAYGLKPDRAESALRLSFSRFTTIDEAKKFLTVFGELLPILRRYGGEKIGRK